jgi:hypothetical protein
MRQVDPFELIKSFKPGLATIGRAKDQADHPWASIFLIREEDRYIKKLGKNPQVEIKSAYIEDGGVGAVFIQFRINLDWDYLYDCWINRYAPGNEKILGDLATQDIFVFKFFDDHEDRRTIGIPNNLKAAFAVYTETAAKLPAWSMRDFDALKERVYAQWLTGREMWLKFFKEQH